MWQIAAILFLGALCLLVLFDWIPKKGKGKADIIVRLYEHRTGKLVHKCKTKAFYVQTKNDVRFVHCQIQVDSNRELLIDKITYSLEMFPDTEVPAREVSMFALAKGKRYVTLLPSENNDCIFKISN